MTRILILGDSTVQWIRPYRTKADDLTYGERLRRNGYSVDIVSSPGMTSKEVHNLYWNNYAGAFYDVIIVSIGINDLSPRSYPRWMWKCNNNNLVQSSYRIKIFSILYRLLTHKKLQELVSKIGFSKSWVSSELFFDYLFRFQKIVLKESNARLIYLSLPLVGERIQSILQGINKNIIEYKEQFDNLIEMNVERIKKIDIQELFKNSQQEYNPEGIHYSADGHRIIHAEIAKEIVAFGL